jgi:hypothetical protein
MAFTRIARARVRGCGLTFYSKTGAEMAERASSAAAGRWPCLFCREAENTVCVADLDAATAREAVPTGWQRARSQKESENDPAMAFNRAPLKLGTRSIHNRLCAGRQRPRRQFGSPATSSGAPPSQTGTAAQRALEIPHSSQHPPTQDAPAANAHHRTHSRPLAVARQHLPQELSQPHPRP